MNSSSTPEQPEQHAPEAPGDGLMSRSKIDNYRSERGAKAYLADHESKLHRRLSDRRERRILQSFLTGCAREGRRLEAMLDCPCGFGRLLSLFSEFADGVVEADFSPSMLALNEELHGAAAREYLRCSALDIPRPDRTFDAVASIRLSHHLESQEDRERHVRELCRVSRDAVVMTFFSAASLKNRLRQVRALWNRKRPKNTLAPSRVQELFAECGFRVERMVPLARVGSGHVYTLARRRPDAR